MANRKFIIFAMQVLIARAEAEKRGEKLPRKPRKVPAPVHPYAQERQLSKLLIHNVRQLFKVIDSRMHRVPVFKAIGTDDYFDRRDLRRTWAKQSIALRPSVEKAMQNVAEVAKSNFRSQVRASLGVDVITGDEGIDQALAVHAREASALIKDIGDQAIDRVSAIVRDGVRRGVGSQKIKQKLQEELGICERRAELIATDQINKLNGALTEIQHRQAGIDTYRWQGVMDQRERPLHIGREGLEFSYGDPPSDGNPGQPVRCVPGDSKLNAGYGAEVFYRRWFTGKLAEVVTESGETLRATPNHPVLTARGWISLGEVHVGDYLFECGIKGIDLIKDDIDHRMPSFAEAFDTISKLAAPVRERGATEQFHGDGTDKDVDIITIAGSLPDWLMSGSGKKACERFLSSADVLLDNALLAPLGSLLNVVRTLWPASDSLVRGACKILALVGGEFSHSNEIRLASIANFYTRLVESSPDGPAIYSVLFGEGELAGTGQIIGNYEIARKVFAICGRASLSAAGTHAPSAENLAKVVGVNSDLSGNILEVGAFVKAPRRVVKHCVSNFSEHVYNLQTSTGWYVTQDYIIHNCRCWAEPVMDLFEGIL